MSKAVLISIRPEWAEKIANGEKTIEVRKTRPNLPTPFKVYIYCTLPRYPHEDYICPEPPAPAFYGGGMVIGEFVCDRIAVITYDGGELACTTNAAFSTASCLSQAEIIEYIGDGGRGYGWSISGLRLYDKPRKLVDFYRPCSRANCDGRFWVGTCEKCAADRRIKRPPQSWMYVEDM